MVQQSWLQNTEIVGPIPKALKSDLNCVLDGVFHSHQWNVSHLQDKAFTE